MNWLYAYDSSEGKKWQGRSNMKPESAEEKHRRMEREEKGEIALAKKERREPRRSLESKLLRQESDLHFTVTEAEGKKIIDNGVIVKSGVDLPAEFRKKYRKYFPEGEKS